LQINLTVAQTIRKDWELYEKLLCFEPVEVEEVQKCLAKEPLLHKLGKKPIRDFLESQGFVLVSATKMPKEVFETAMFRPYRRR